MFKRKIIQYEYFNLETFNMSNDEILNKINEMGKEGWIARDFPNVNNTGRNLWLMRIIR